MRTRPARTLEWDWHAGTIPENVVLDETAFVETTFSFYLYRSEAKVGVSLGPGAATYLGTMFDVGPSGHVRLGRCTMVHGAWFMCESEIEVGDYSLLSWNVVVMDSYRLPLDPGLRREELRRVPKRRPRRIEGSVEARPVSIEANVWIGFDVCVLPGVTIGEGSIVGARSVVADDVPPYTIAAGNPARVIRSIERE